MNSNDILCWRDTVGSLFISSPKLSIKITAKDGLLSIGDLTCGTRTTVLPCDIASFSVAEASKEYMGHLTLTLTETPDAPETPEIPEIPEIPEMPEEPEESENPAINGSLVMPTEDPEKQ